MFHRKPKGSKMLERFKVQLDDGRIMPLMEFVHQFDAKKAHEEIMNESEKENQELSLLRESAECWALIAKTWTPDTPICLDTYESEMFETLQNCWGEKAGLILDRKRGTAHATHPNGKCMNLLTGEVIELEETGS